jgi:hypothetical protein
MRVIVLILILLSAALGGKTPAVRLQQVVAAAVPELQEGRMYYHIDFVFKKRAPQHFWVYYDQATRTARIDCYGIELEAADSAMGLNALFQNIRIENATTPFSLNGQRAQVVMDADTGWSLGASLRDSVTIRLDAWRYLKVPVKPRRVSNPLLTLVIVPVAVGVGALLVLLRAQ